MDRAFPVGLGVLRAEQIHLVIGLRAGGADLKHGAHGRVAVDVGVVPLHVAGPGVDPGDLVDGLHQGRIRLPGTGPVGPVEDIRLGRVGEAVVHQLLLHLVLNGLNIGGRIFEFPLQLPLHVVGHPGSIGGVALPGGLHGLEDCGRDLILVIQDDTAVPLDDALDHFVLSSLPYSMDSPAKRTIYGIVCFARHYILSRWSGNVKLLSAVFVDYGKLCGKSRNHSTIFRFILLSPPQYLVFSRHNAGFLLFRGPCLSHVYFMWIPCKKCDIMMIISCLEGPL